jgi:hypothetical protein
VESADVYVYLLWSKTSADRGYNELVTLQLDPEPTLGTEFDYGGCRWKTVKRVSAADQGFRSAPEAWAFICEPVRECSPPGVTR